MTRMSGTFACPHCGAQYPIKPVLVGRAVRCTTCKKPFRLREDGVADKVEDQPVAPTKPATAAVTKPPPAPAPAPAAPTRPATEAVARRPAADDVEVITKRPAVDDVEVIPKKTPTPVPDAPDPDPAKRPPPARRTDRINKEQMEAQRKSMAASLASAASAALESESVKKDQQQKPERKSKRFRRGEGGTGDIGPAVLSGFGEHEHRNNMLWLFGSLGLIAALVLAIILFSLRSEERKALDTFTAVVEGERGRYGERMVAIQERAWLTGVAPLVDLGNPSIGSSRLLKIDGLDQVLAPLKGMDWHAQREYWRNAKQDAQIDQVWDESKDRAANLERLKQARAQVLSGEDLLTQFTTAGWSEDDAALLVRLLTGSATRGNENWIAKNLLAGKFPQAIELCPFSGTGGSELIDLGRSYRTRDEVSYEGLLMRFSGGGDWPREWRVITLVTSARDADRS